MVEMILTFIIAVIIIILIGLYFYVSWCFMKRFLWPEDDYEININRLFCTIWTFSIGLPVTAIMYLGIIICWLINKIARLGR